MPRCWARITGAKSPSSRLCACQLYRPKIHGSGNDGKGLRAPARRTGPTGHGPVARGCRTQAQGCGGQLHLRRPLERRCPEYQSPSTIVHALGSADQHVHVQLAGCVAGSAGRAEGCSLMGLSRIRATRPPPLFRAPFLWGRPRDRPPRTCNRQRANRAVSQSWRCAGLSRRRTPSPGACAPGGPSRARSTFHPTSEATGCHRSGGGRPPPGARSDRVSYLIASAGGSPALASIVLISPCVKEVAGRTVAVQPGTQMVWAMLPCFTSSKNAPGGSVKRRAARGRCASLRRLRD